jgi:hypothetical protein
MALGQNGVVYRLFRPDWRSAVRIINLAAAPGLARRERSANQLTSRVDEASIVEARKEEWQLRDPDHT